MSSNTIVCKNEGHLAALFAKLRDSIKQKPIKIKAEFVKCTRSVEQNAKLQAMVRDFMRQVEWKGLGKNQEHWRHFLAACFMKQQAVEGLEGGLVFINTKTTSRFSLKEATDFIDWLYAIGLEYDVEWSE